MKNISRLTIFLLFVIINSTLYSNEFQASYKIGYGSFGMSGLRKMQNDIAWSYHLENISVAVVDEFPDFYTHDFSVSMSINPTINLGISIGFLSSGGKLHYSDYSGEISIKNYLDCFIIGPFIELNIINKESFRILCKLDARLSSTDLKIIQDFTLLQTSISEQLDFVSTGINIEPSIAIEYNLSILSFRLELGYSMDFSDALHLKDDEDVKLITSGSDEVIPDWSGKRIGFVLGIRL